MVLAGEGNSYLENLNNNTNAPVGSIIKSSEMDN